MTTLLTTDQIQVLRIACGLVNGAKKPTRDEFPRSCVPGREDTIESLIDMELMTRRPVYGPRAAPPVLLATDQGRRVLMDFQARYDDLYDQVDAQMVAENIADGGACDYRPDGAQVHAMVEKMMRE